MSCYFRHIKSILDAAGIEVTATNKKQIDHAIHQAVGVTYKDCPATWKRLKKQIISGEHKRQELTTKLQDAIR